MNRNIIIIAVAAVSAFLAVLLIPRLLDRDSSDDAPSSVASSDSGSDSGDTGSVGSDGPASVGDKDDTASPANNVRPANPALEAEIAEAVREVNAAGPVVIDELTTMTAARARGIRIQYRYEISRELNAGQVQQFRQLASTQNPQTICARPETRRLIDAGGEIEYVYYGPGDRYLFNTPITGC